MAVRWYLRYGLSYRDAGELLAERGITVDGSVALGDPWAASRSCLIVSRSDGQCQIVEGEAEPAVAGDVGGDVVMAAAQILHEGMTGSKDPR